MMELTERYMTSFPLASRVYKNASIMNGCIERSAQSDTTMTPVVNAFGGEKYIPGSSKGTESITLNMIIMNRRVVSSDSCLPIIVSWGFSIRIESYD
jgi:hypothetical protein